MPRKQLANPIVVDGQVLTADLVNQISENANPQRDISFLRVEAAGSNLTTSGTFTAVTETLLAHTTRSGRVRLVLNATLSENASPSAAAGYGLALYFAAGTTPPNTNTVSGGAAHSFLSVVAASSNNLTMVEVVTGLTPDTSYQFQLFAQRTTGTGRLRLQRCFFTVEDI